MAAALAIEVTLGATNVWSAPQTFRGRVNAYVEGTFTGHVRVERRFPKLNSTFTAWMPFLDFNGAGGLQTFVEHEDGVQYQIGSDPSAFSGTGVFARLSQ